jgi:tricorn protease
MRGLLALIVVLLSLQPLLAAEAPPHLLQHPSLSASSIAFDYAGAIWTVPRQGGEARLVAQGQGDCEHPIFSPDGRQIAYTARIDDNVDVYVIDAAGGEPRRLTWHPGEDVAVGWTPDGKNVLFRSLRASPRDLAQLYSVPAGGGVPKQIELPSVDDASLSPDGARIAYTPFDQWQPAWKHYRGGQTARIWIADLASGKLEKLPRDNSNDRNPLWIGAKVYFLSDRDGPVTLYAYDPAGKSVKKLVDNDKGFDIVSAGAGPDAIVYDQFGALKLYEIGSGQSHEVKVEIKAELAQLRPHLEPLVPPQSLDAELTPTGKRVLIEARGEILSVPVEKGDTRNLTQSPGVADRSPSASPDGRQIAYFSDESGEYALHVRAADGKGEVRKFPLGEPPSFFYDPVWAPVEERLVYRDKRLNLWTIDLKSGKTAKIDTDLFDSPRHNFDAAWSPDGKWVTYTKQLPNHLHAVFLYSLDSGKSVQLTDGMSDAYASRFDRGGKYLYFIATTSIGQGAGWLDMSSMGRAVDGTVYAVVLRKDQPSPVAPESDEEEVKKPGDKKAADSKKDEDKKGKEGDGKGPAKPAAVRIDLDGIERRIVSLPLPNANYGGLETGAEGVIFAVADKTAMTDQDILDAEESPPESVVRFTLKERKPVTLLEGIDAGSFRLSADGAKMLFAREHALFVTASDAPPKGGDGAVKLDQVSVWVDPRQEWRQMYNEVWRLERDFLYDPNLQGLDYKKAQKLYARFLDGLGSRRALNALFEEMTGHIGIGHTFVRGGAFPNQPHIPVGLLGADFEAVDGRFRIAHIYAGENWNPKLSAPLTQPGLDIAEGEFILAVNGRDITSESEIYRFFQGLAGKQTVLTLAPKADGKKSRQVTVVPIDSESKLRLHDWMESNRRKVDKLSGGKLAYVFLPDTYAGGFANFNRYYFAQVGKQGVVLDERFNHGGSIADYIIDTLKRTPQMVNQSREGADMIEPAEAIFGPKVMIINQMSGSGGDAMPWLFHKAGLGPLVGTRTWGGLVGIGGYPSLIDGGHVTAPRWAIFGTKGEWEVENIGIAPDVEVEQDPVLVRQGHDPQLEKAVQEALDQLAKSPPPVFKRPPAPDRKPVLPD